MNEMLINFLMGPLLYWLPKFFFGLIFLSAVYLYIRRQENHYKKLITISVVFYLLFAAALTAGQYYVWSQGPFTKILVSTPLDQEAMEPILKSFYPLFDHELGYFMFYVLGRFWLEVILVVVLAIAFYFFLKALTHYRQGFFKDKEEELGLLMALIAGWPNFIIFLVLTFVIVIAVALYRSIVLKEAYTTLVIPFLIAAGLTLLFGDYLAKLLNLTVLKV